MANNIIKRVWNQNKMVNIEDLSGSAFQAESGGHTFQISGIDETGASVALSGTVAGVFRRPDNADIALTGSASGGVVSVTLAAGCYAIPGRFGLTIFVTSGGQKTAVYACVGTVANTSGGAVAGSTPQDVVDLINAISAAVATIPASYSDLMTAIAPMYSNSALYPVGSYVWHDGHLYRCTTAITTAETWTAAHWTAAVFGDDIGDLKSALRAKEVNTWNMWDGSWGLVKANPVTGSSISYVVCGPSIPVTAGQYYSVGVVDNPLYSDLVKVIGIYWYDANNTRLSFSPAYPQGGYLKWMQAPSGAVKAVPYYNTNDATVPLSVEQVKAGGYKWFFAARLINFSNRDSAGQYAINANEWIPSYLWDDNSIERTRTTIVTVGATNSNFTSLRDAIDAINSYGGASETNRFEVRIKEGTYDISSYYTSAEKAQSGFVGLTVPDWVTLKGVGNREKTILQYVLETASNKICVLNLQNTCSLENLTLYGVKTRYCVHDDKANYIGTPYKRFCKNVHFKGDTMTLGAVYGAGINSNAEWIFEDCIFESLTETNYQNCFSVHGSGQQVQVGSSSVLFDNCRFIGHGSSLNNALILSTLMNNASYFQNYCNLKGCSANGRLILREENASSYGAGIAWWATGFATTFTDEIISNTDGVDYSDHIDII